jgi:hypothetical protein
MRGAFSGKLGPEMKAHAQEWADSTPNIKDLPEHKNKVTFDDKKKNIIKKAVRKHTGKGGPLLQSSFKEASSPINLLKLKGSPPTTKGIPKSRENI